MLFYRTSRRCWQICREHWQKRNGKQKRISQWLPPDSSSHGLSIPSWKDIEYLVGGISYLPTSSRIITLPKTRSQLLVSGWTCIHYKLYSGNPHLLFNSGRSNRHHFPCLTAGPGPWKERFSSEEAWTKNQSVFVLFWNQESKWKGHTNSPSLEV